jgi:hypothetical protein
VKTLAVIPARYASTRLRQPLVLVGGIPLVVRVFVGSLRRRWIGFRCRGRRARCRVVRDAGGEWFSPPRIFPALRPSAYEATEPP